MSSPLTHVERAAPGKAQQSDPSKTISATVLNIIVTRCYVYV